MGIIIKPFFPANLVRLRTIVGLLVARISSISMMLPPAPSLEAALGYGEPKVRVGALFEECHENTKK